MNQNISNLIGGGPAGGVGNFPNPWLDVASTYMPTSMHDVFSLCEFLYVANPTWRSSSETIASYLTTKISYAGQSPAELKKVEKINKENKLLNFTKESSVDALCYGNSFSSALNPIRRNLVCKSCSRSRSIENVKYVFDAGSISFKAYCPTCRGEQTHGVKDYQHTDPSMIRLVRWDPKRIKTKINEFTGEVQYRMDLDPMLIAKIKAGDKFVLKSTPWSVIYAACKGWVYEFDKDYFFHMKEGCLAGIRLGGMGVPSILSSFRQLFRLQVMQRYDEALMLDYIVPMRILSPAPTSTSGGNEMTAIAAMGEFRQQFARSVIRHRTDSADWHIFPFAVEYQEVGAKNTFVTKELIQMEEDRLLASRGAPADFYRMTLTQQAAPVALRLMEKRWQWLFDAMCDQVQWATTIVSRLSNAGDVDATMDSIQVVDNVERQAYMLQLMAANQISKQTTLKNMDIDSEEERKRVLEEQADAQRDQAQAARQVELEALSLNSASNPDGEGGAEDGSSSEVSMEETYSNGQAIAAQLLDPRVSSIQRNQKLKDLRQMNPTLHAIVRKEMDKQRQAAGQAGRDQVLAQNAQQVPQG